MCWVDGGESPRPSEQAKMKVRITRREESRLHGKVKTTLSFLNNLAAYTQ